jgi:cytochrome oxidase Cu insertion factor (SCO1/SenC/PrrC family)
MRRGPAAFVVGAAVLALLGSACSRAGNSGGDSGATDVLSVGDPAPDFTLRSAQGADVSLAGFRGNKPVLLYFSMGPG